MTGWCGTSTSPGARNDVAHVQAVLDRFKELKAEIGRSLVVLADPREMESVTGAARKVASGPEFAEVVDCMAVLTGSPMAAFFGNLFLKFDRPRFELRLFDDPDEAIAWLRVRALRRAA